MKYRNLPDLFFKKADRKSSETLLRYKNRHHLPFESITWKESAEIIEDITYGLKAIEAKASSNIALLAETCHEWLLCDLGILSYGAATVPIYHSSTKDTVQYIVNHAEVEIIFVRNKIQLQKIRSLWSEMPQLRYVIVMQDKGDIPTNDPKILTLNDLIKLGDEERKHYPDFVEKRRNEIQLEDIASIIYTSGTTGTPKGVVLTHKNILTAAMSFYQYVPLEDNWNLLSFLPLAHVFERVCGQFYGLDQGLVFTYCDKPERLPGMLKESKANIMMVVPRMLEKIHARIMQKVGESGFIKKTLFHKALETSLEYMRKKVHKEEIPKYLLVAHQIAQKTVLSKIKEAVAPDIEVFVVGGAPFSEELNYFYLALGFTVIEGYGLTETSAPITVNPMWGIKPGTVGVPFTHFEVKITEEGEIACKGPAVFQGYYKNEEETKEVIRDGWFYTGDLGKFDEDGYLKITGRKKDLIITAAGKNVSPSRVESKLLESQFLNQVIVLGDQEKYLAALVVIDELEVRKYFSEKNIEIPKTNPNWEQIPEVKELLSKEIEKHSQELASFEQIKAFAILDKELTIESGELTPTLKVKRNVVRKNYADLIKPLFNLSKKSRA